MNFEQLYSFTKPPGTNENAPLLTNLCVLLINFFYNMYIIWNICSADKVMNIDSVETVNFLITCIHYLDMISH